MINAAITPGIQPHKVSRNTITKDPQPFPITAKGGKIIANKTLRQPILDLFFDRCTYIRRFFSKIVTCVLVLLRMLWQYDNLGHWICGTKIYGQRRKDYKIVCATHFQLLFPEC